MTTVALYLLRTAFLVLILLGTALTYGGSSALSWALTTVLGITAFIVGLSVGLKGAFLLGLAAVVSSAISAFDVILAAFLLGHSVGEIFNEEGRKEEENFSKELLVLVFLSLSVIYLGAAVTAIKGESVLSIIVLTIKAGGPFHLFTNFTVIFPEVASALRELCGFLLLSCLGSALLVERDVKAAVFRFIRGASYGLLIAPLFYFSQLLGGPILGTFQKIHQIGGQFPASSSSPQALAVVVVLLLPFVLLISNIVLRIALVLAALFLGVVSGSGLFFFGLFLLGVGTLYRVVTKFKRFELNVAFVVGVSGFLFSLVLLGHPAVNEAVGKTIGGAGVLRQLNWNERESVFFIGAISRAVRAWQESPVIGVGLERLNAMEQLSLKSAGFDPSQTLIGGKSYYLQLLAESGLFGVSIFLLAVTLLFTILLNPYLEGEGEVEDNRIQRFPSINYQIAARISLLALAVLLLSGNPLAYPEVRAITAVLIVAGCIRPVLVRRIILAQFRVGTFSALFLFCFGFLVLLGISSERVKSVGFYQPEDPLNPNQRYTTDRGQIVVCDNRLDTMVFRLRAIRPRLNKYPVSIALHEGVVDLGDTTQLFELINSEWVQVIVPLRPDQDGRFTNAVVSFTVSPLFSSKYAGVGEDPRFTGVLIELPPGAC